MRFHIENMTCGHCIRSVTLAIQAIAPSAIVKIDLARKSGDIEGPLTSAQVVAALEAAGYPATPMGETTA